MTTGGLLRIVFMGTPSFAVPSLALLAREHEVALVVTRPDAVSSRGSKPSPSAVKSFAAASGIDVMEVSSLRDRQVPLALRAVRPHVVCVAAFGMILPPEVLAIPPMGCVNVHASLLPRHRGAAPVQRAILEGDETTGVSIMLMEEGLDTGPVCATREVAVGRISADELTGTLACAGAELLAESLRRLRDGEAAWTPQDDASATYASAVKKGDVALGPDLTVREADSRVRASNDSAPARLDLAGRGVRVLLATPDPQAVPKGLAVPSQGGLLLGCADGALLVERLRPDGRSDLSGPDYVRGWRETSARWSRP